MFKLPAKMNLNRLTVAVMLIIIGTCGRILLISYANIETVLAIALLSGVILGGYYCIAVPLSVMLISDWWIYTYTDHVGYFGIWAIIGLTFFTWTGYIMIGIIGRFIKPRIAYTVKGVAVITGTGLVVTIIYDLWTVIGYWIFLTPATTNSLITVLIMQAPFTVYHLMSSLIFVPLFGTLFMYLHEHGVPFLGAFSRPSRERDEAIGYWGMDFMSAKVKGGMEQ
ncbi:MAG: hypothetical protein JSW28_02030 [Thermoplasmata archaeon]|nr:MAG: hypothetical protein JSW28_02030 [Thermoplasmata archaeon]